VTKSVQANKGQKEKGQKQKDQEQKDMKQNKKNQEKTSQEDALADELQLIGLLKENADIFTRHPELLDSLDLSHETGGAISLIERQIQVLREKNNQLDKRLCELMDVARDNERLAQSRHRIALNLLSAHDLNDVVSIVLAELSNELKADFAVVKLFTEKETWLKQHPQLFVANDSDGINAFKTMRNHKNPVCGRGTEEQKTFLFADDAKQIESVAIIPLTAGADLGLIGLGSEAASRFQASLGTQFLSQMGDLVSAALAVHLEGESE